MARSQLDAARCGMTDRQSQGANLQEVVSRSGGQREGVPLVMADVSALDEHVLPGPAPSHGLQHETIISFHHAASLSLRLGAPNYTA